MHVQECVSQYKGSTKMIEWNMTSFMVKTVSFGTKKSFLLMNFWWRLESKTSRAREKKKQKNPSLILTLLGFRNQSLHDLDLISSICMVKIWNVKKCWFCTQNSQNWLIFLSKVNRVNVYFKKNGTKRSNNTLLHFVPVFLKQTLSHNIYFIYIELSTQTDSCLVSTKLFWVWHKKHRYRVTPLSVVSLSMILGIVQFKIVQIPHIVLWSFFLKK